MRREEGGNKGKKTQEDYRNKQDIHLRNSAAIKTPAALHYISTTEKF
jgi:hypothetical protein